MIRALPFALALAACGGGTDDETKPDFTPGSTSGEGSCTVASSEARDMDTVGAVEHNYTATQVLSELGGPTLNVLTWPDELTDGLTVDFEYVDGPINYVVREAEGVLTASEAASCVSGLEITGTLRFSNQLGEFNEEFADAVLLAYKRQEGSFRLSLPTDQLVGTWTAEVSGLDTSGFSSVTLEWLGTIVATGSDGTLYAWGDDGTGELTKLIAATWIEVPEQG